MLVGEHGLYWASGIARTPSMLGHSMHGHITLVKTSVQSAEAFRGVGGLLPQKVEFTASKSALRLYRRAIQVTYGKLVYGVQHPQFCRYGDTAPFDFKTI